MRFGTLVTFDVGVSIGESLDAMFAKKCAKFRHGSIAAIADLGRLSRRYRLRVSAYSFEFRVASFWGCFNCSELGGNDRPRYFCWFEFCLLGFVEFSIGGGVDRFWMRLIFHPDFGVGWGTWGVPSCRTDIAQTLMELSG